VSGAGIGFLVDLSLVAEYEVGESYASFTIVPSGVVVVRTIGVVRSGSPLPVARIQVAKASDVLVVVDAVVTGLTVLETVRGGHLCDLAILVPSDEPIDWVAVQCEADDG